MTDLANSIDQFANTGPDRRSIRQTRRRSVRREQKQRHGKYRVPGGNQQDNGADIFCSVC